MAIFVKNHVNGITEVPHSLHTDGVATMALDRAGAVTLEKAVGDLDNQTIVPEPAAGDGHGMVPCATSSPTR